jgi:hypothetical protein
MIVTHALNAPLFVSNRYAIPKVSRVAPATLDLKAPLNAYTRVKPDKERQTESTSRGRHSVNSAAPGFAAQILVEAGLTGSDPYAGIRGAKAYQPEKSPSPTLRLIA